MKLSHYTILVLILIISACEKPANQNNEEGLEEREDVNPNQALYEKVMDLHDEVMPKMEDIYKIQSQIKEKIVNSPNLVKERKVALGQVALQLDSANKAMMDWMHDFQPLPDSADEEEARAYLESQMERIKKVKDEMLIAIERGKEEVIKNN
ncbi:MAG TPA: hypothetical protein VIS49_01815 [Cyclobacteriaceae bacterium]